MQAGVGFMHDSCVFPTGYTAGAVVSARSCVLVKLFVIRGRLAVSTTVNARNCVLSVGCWRQGESMM